MGATSVAVVDTSMVAGESHVAKKERLLISATLVHVVVTAVLTVVI